jgi:hypothetical protein
MLAERKPILMIENAEITLVLCCQNDLDDSKMEKTKTATVCAFQDIEEIFYKEYRKMLKEKACKRSEQVKQLQDSITK